jgi:hypothetical protein
MGKYLIKVESMDHDEVLDSEFVEGVECDGFVVLAHKGDGCKVMLHKVSINIISDMIASSKKLMAAGILAKAKVDVKAQLRQDEMDDLLGRLLGRD